jgi:hypothetical protein
MTTVMVVVTTTQMMAIEIHGGSGGSGARGAMEIEVPLMQSQRCLGSRAKLKLNKGLAAAERGLLRPVA